MSILGTYGWSSYFAQSFGEYAERGLVPGRVLSEFKSSYHLVAECGELSARLAGRARYESVDHDGLPAVGDWVAIRVDATSDHATIHAVLPRRSSFSRKVAGDRIERQVVAANVDLAFIVMGLDGDFNLRRLERYLTVANEGRVEPVVVLNKADLCSDYSKRRSAVAAVAHDIAIHVVSAETGLGLDALRSALAPGTTTALLGSSGVGKSSLVNRLTGLKMQRTGEVRESDSRGRHTTTRREIILLPSGGLLVDTPGMRELQIWGADDGLDEAFGDIESLAAECRFRDCRHEGEPDCAVVAAVDSGLLDPHRLRNHFTLRREAEAMATRRDAAARRAEKARWKSITKSMRNFKKGW